MFEVDDKVRFWDTHVNHVNGVKGEIVAIHKGLNCVTISYKFDSQDGLLIQVNNCQVVKLKEKKD